MKANISHIKLDKLFELWKENESAYDYCLKYNPISNKWEIWESEYLDTRLNFNGDLKTVLFEQLKEAQ